MRGSDPDGKSGPQKSLPDTVTIIEPKEESNIITPNSQDYGKKLAAQQAAAQAEATSIQQETPVESGQEYTPPLEASNTDW